MIGAMVSVSSAATCCMFDSLPTLLVLDVLTPVVYELIYKSNQAWTRFTNGPAITDTEKTIRKQEHIQTAIVGLGLLTSISIIKPDVLSRYVYPIVSKAQQVVRPLFIEMLKYLSVYSGVPVESMAGTFLFHFTYGISRISWIIVGAVVAYKIISKLNAINN